MYTRYVYNDRRWRSLPCIPVPSQMAPMFIAAATCSVARVGRVELTVGRWLLCHAATTLYCTVLFRIHQLHCYSSTSLLSLLLHLSCGGDCDPVAVVHVLRLWFILHTRSKESFTTTWRATGHHLLENGYSTKDFFATGEVSTHFCVTTKRWAWSLISLGLAALLK